MSNEVIIRDLRFCDIPDVQKIIEENWIFEIASKSGLEMKEMFGNAKWPPHYYVAEMNGQVVGCGGLKSAWLMSNTYELIWINVDKQYQGNGIGKLLIEKRINHIKNLGGTLILLMTQKPWMFSPYQFSYDRLYNDGWVLMSLQLKPISLSGDV